jgi:hypothetical protein
MKTFDNCLMNAIMFLITITISVYIIQLMQKNIKETEERFFTATTDEPIINIHSDDTEKEPDEGGQYLYKFNLDVGVSLTATDIQVFENNKLPLKNIIAMFPISDDIVYILDSTLQLYIVTMDNNTPPLTREILPITGFDPNSGRPVKVVTTNDNIYILTDTGSVFKNGGDGLSDITFTKLNSIDNSIDNAIDIAVNSGNRLFFIENTGKLYEYITTSSSIVHKHTDLYFTQIVSNRDTEFVYGVSSNREIHLLSSINNILMINSLATFDIRLMCSGNKFGYLYGNRFILRVVNVDEIITLIPGNITISQVKDVLMFDEDKVLYLNENETIYIKTIDEHELLRINNGNAFHPKKDPFKNMTIFTGTSLANIFVLVQDHDLTCPDNLSSASPNPNCLDLCIDTDMNDPVCADIFNAISSLIEGSACPT